MKFKKHCYTISTRIKLKNLHLTNLYLHCSVENLLKSGALTKKPVWYDVVKAFPPLVETKINRRAEPGRAPKIVYPEDEFRK